MTPTDTNAVKADVLPRLMRPSSICTMVRRKRAQMGTPKRGETRDHRAAPGTASSREMAQVQRDAALVMLMEQKRVMARTRKMRPRPPPGLVGVRKGWRRSVYGYRRRGE